MVMINSGRRVPWNILKIPFTLGDNMHRGWSCPWTLHTGLPPVPQQLTVCQRLITCSGPHMAHDIPHDAKNRLLKYPEGHQEPEGPYSHLWHQLAHKTLHHVPDSILILPGCIQRVHTPGPWKGVPCRGGAPGRYSMHSHGIRVEQPHRG